MDKSFNRRKFLQTTALGSLGIVAGQSVQGSSPSRSEKKVNPPFLKIGLMTYNLAKEWDTDTIIKNCTETGYLHAELRTTHKHGVEVSLSKKERLNVKKRFEDSDLEAISLASAFKYHSPNPKELKKNIEGTKEYLQLAADVGALGIRVFPNEFPKDVSREKTIEQIGKALAEVGEFGYNLGVDVRVCAHGRGTAEIPVVKSIFDASGSNHVYMNWNCNPTDDDGAGLEANFNTIKDRIKGIHLHEMYSEYPYRKFFSLLRESGYKGYCNAEIAASSDPIRVMKYYKALFMALQNQI